MSLALPKIEKTSDAAVAASAILGAVSAGEVTPCEAGELIKMVESYARTLQASEIESRIEKLEAEIRGGR